MSIGNRNQIKTRKKVKNRQYRRKPKFNSKKINLQRGGGKTSNKPMYESLLNQIKQKISVENLDLSATQQVLLRAVKGQLGIDNKIVKESLTAFLNKKYIVDKTMIELGGKGGISVKVLNKISNYISDEENKSKQQQRKDLEKIIKDLVNRGLPDLSKIQQEDREIANIFSDLTMQIMPLEYMTNLILKNDIDDNKKNRAYIKYYIVKFYDSFLDNLVLLSKEEFVVKFLKTIIFNNRKRLTSLKMVSIQNMEIQNLKEFFFLGGSDKLAVIINLKNKDKNFYHKSMNDRIESGFSNFFKKDYDTLRQFNILFENRESFTFKHLLFLFDSVEFDRKEESSNFASNYINDLFETETFGKLFENIPVEKSIRDASPLNQISFKGGGESKYNFVKVEEEIKEQEIKEQEKKHVSELQSIENRINMDTDSRTPLIDNFTYEILKKNPGIVKDLLETFDLKDEKLDYKIIEALLNVYNPNKENTPKEPQPRFKNNLTEYLTTILSAEFIDINLFNVGVNLFNELKNIKFSLKEYGNSEELNPFKDLDVPEKTQPNSPSIFKFLLITTRIFEVLRDNNVIGNLTFELFDKFRKNYLQTNEVEFTDNDENIQAQTANDKQQHLDKIFGEVKPKNEKTPWYRFSSSTQPNQKAHTLRTQIESDNCFDAFCNLLSFLNIVEETNNQNLDINGIKLMNKSVFEKIEKSLGDITSESLFKQVFVESLKFISSDYFEERRNKLGVNLDNLIYYMVGYNQNQKIIEDLNQLNLESSIEQINSNNLFYSNVNNYGSKIELASNIIFVYMLQAKYYFFKQHVYILACIPDEEKKKLEDNLKMYSVNLPVKYVHIPNEFIKTIEVKTNKGDKIKIGFELLLGQFFDFINYLIIMKQYTVESDVDLFNKTVKFEEKYGKMFDTNTENLEKIKSLDILRNTLINYESNNSEELKYLIDQTKVNLPKEFSEPIEKLINNISSDTDRLKLTKKYFTKRGNEFNALSIKAEAQLQQKQSINRIDTEIKNLNFIKESLSVGGGIERLKTLKKELRYMPNLRLSSYKETNEGKEAVRNIKLKIDDKKKEYVLDTKNEILGLRFDIEKKSKTYWWMQIPGLTRGFNRYVEVKSPLSKFTDLHEYRYLYSINNTIINFIPDAKVAQENALKQNTPLTLRVHLERNINKVDIEEEIRILNEIKRKINECFRIYDSFKQTEEGKIFRDEELTKGNQYPSLLAILYELVVQQRDIGTMFNIFVDTSNPALIKSANDFKNADNSNDTECIKNLKGYLSVYSSDLAKSKQSQQKQFNNKITLIELLTSNIEIQDTTFDYTKHNVGEVYFNNIRQTLYAIQQIEDKGLDKAKEILKNFNDIALESLTSAGSEQDESDLRTKFVGYAKDALDELQRKLEKELAENEKLKKELEAAEAQAAAAAAEAAEAAERKATEVAAQLEAQREAAQAQAAAAERKAREEAAERAKAEAQAREAAEAAERKAREAAEAQAREAAEAERKAREAAAQLKAQREAAEQAAERAAKRGATIKAYTKEFLDDTVIRKTNKETLKGKENLNDFLSSLVFEIENVDYKEEIISLLKSDSDELAEKIYDKGSTEEAEYLKKKIIAKLKEIDGLLFEKLSKYEVNEKVIIMEQFIKKGKGEIPFNEQKNELTNREIIFNTQNQKPNDETKRFLKSVINNYLGELYNEGGNGFINKTLNDSGELFSFKNEDDIATDGYIMDVDSYVRINQMIIDVTEKFKKIEGDRAIILDNVETLIVVNKFIGTLNGPVYLENLPEKFDNSIKNDPQPSDNYIAVPLSPGAYYPKPFYVQKNATIDKIVTPLRGDVITKTLRGETQEITAYYQRRLTIKNDKGICLLDLNNKKHLKNTIDLNNPESGNDIKAGSFCFDDESKNNNLHYSYAKEFEGFKSRTLNNAEQQDELKNTRTEINRVATETDKNLILFVFGITGSGKDTFLNTVYGLKGIFNNNKIHDQDDDKNSKDNHIEEVLKVNSNKINEFWYYVNGTQIGNTEKQINDAYQNVSGYQQFMRKSTPFNPQSTRGFNIKKIKNTHSTTTTTTYTSVINVPGFEPMHSILLLHLIQKTKYTDNNILYSGDGDPDRDQLQLFSALNRKIIHPGFYKILRCVLLGKPDKDTMTLILPEGIDDTKNIVNNYNDYLTIKSGSEQVTQKNFEYIYELLTQSCYILQTLNIMGALLTNYVKIRDWINKKTEIGKDENGNKKITENIDIIYNYIKEEYMIGKEISEFVENITIEDVDLIKMYNLDGGIEADQKQKYLNLFDDDKGVKFPIDKKLEFLKPFYTESGRFVYFKADSRDINPIFTQSINDNQFIKKLIEILFQKEGSNQERKINVRYNVNVIRPLRHVYESLIDVNVITLDSKKVNSRTGKDLELERFHIVFDAYNNPRNEANGGSEKIMLDSTLIGTLEGFCNIRKGDTE